MHRGMKWYWIHCLSGLHIGSGEGVGVIDLPIQREKVTEWPQIPASSVKGSKRHYYVSMHSSFNVSRAFGQEGERGNAGEIVFTDGRLLAFPVASRYGTFAYVTCPLVLKRFERDAQAMGETLKQSVNWEEFEKGLQKQKPIEVWSTEGSVVVEQDRDGNGEKIYLDEFYAEVCQNETLTKWADWIGGRIFEDAISRKLWNERLVLVSDETFQYFTTMCCEVTPRIRLEDDSKTTKRGALWYEEYVPAETIFYGMVWADWFVEDAQEDKRESLLEQLHSNVIMQMGGNANVGKGRVRIRLTGGEVG